VRYTEGHPQGVTVPIATSLQPNTSQTVQSLQHSPSAMLGSGTLQAVHSTVQPGGGGRRGRQGYHRPTSPVLRYQAPQDAPPAPVPSRRRKGLPQGQVGQFFAQELGRREWGGGWERGRG